MDETGAEHHLLAKKAHARVEPLKVVPWVMTVLLLMVPPALCSVEPKMAKKMIGAMKLLRAKKYWTLAVLVKFMSFGRVLVARPYLGVRDA